MMRNDNTLAVAQSTTTCPHSKLFDRGPELLRLTRISTARWSNLRRFVGVANACSRHFTKIGCSRRIPRNRKTTLLNSSARRKQSGTDMSHSRKKYARSESLRLFDSSIEQSRVVRRSSRFIVKCLIIHRVQKYLRRCSRKCERCESLARAMACTCQSP